MTKVQGVNTCNTIVSFDIIYFFAKNYICNTVRNVCLVDVGRLNKKFEPSIDKGDHRIWNKFLLRFVSLSQVILATWRCWWK